MTGIVKAIPLDCTGTHFYQICTYHLHRYTCLPNSCISLASVHIYTKFVHIACTGTYLHQIRAYRLHRYIFTPCLPRPIGKRPQRRSCTRCRGVECSRLDFFCQIKETSEVRGYTMETQSDGSDKITSSSCEICDPSSTGSRSTMHYGSGTRGQRLGVGVKGLGFRVEGKQFSVCH